MFEIYREEVEWGGRTLKLETGRMARQADGAVLAQYGETSVLATVVGNARRTPRRTSSPLQSTIRRRLTRRAKSQADISSAKADRRNVKRWFRGLSTARSGRCSRPDSRTRRRLSSRCCRTTWRTIPISWPGCRFGGADAVGLAFPWSDRRVEGRLCAWPIHSEPHVGSDEERPSSISSLRARAMPCYGGIRRRRSFRKR